MRGKLNAFGSFRDILAENMTTAMPELRDDVAQVVEATGGVPLGRRNGEQSQPQQNGSASNNHASSSAA
jgi:mediator of RNA polymerase II transcription subunit 10